MNEIYFKEVLVKGRPTRIKCLDIDGVTLTISSGIPRIVTVEDEWFADLNDPQAIAEQLRSWPGLRADILAFWNPIPDQEPKFSYSFEAEDVAVLKIVSYQDWWSKRISAKTRNLVRKAEKKSVVVRETIFDDEFVRGMTTIFNEQPIRQGRRFWHYGKDFETVRGQFARYVQREKMIAAYVGTEMIGFVMLGIADRCAHLGQILSKTAERDRSPTNALMAKAVEVSAREGREFLIYGRWGDTTLADFKRHSGFSPVPVPHFFVPLSRQGALALRCKLHRGWSNWIPPDLKNRMRRWRAWAYEWRGA